MKFTPLQELWFYCDETSQHTGNHMAIGGIAVHANRRKIIAQEFQNIKSSKGIPEESEMKWEKTSNKHLPAYKAIVDFFFSLVEANHLHFHIMLAEHKRLNHRLHSDGSKETSVSRFYYQLLKHRCCQFYGHKSIIHVRPDDGNCTNYLPRMLKGLNNDSRKTFGIKHFPILSINCTNSENEPLLQLNDIIIGGIASYHNKRFSSPNASTHKTELAAYILMKFGWNNYSKETARNAKRISLWHYNPKTSAPAPRLSSNPP